MSQSFTAVEYAVLSHVRTERLCTIPAIAADLLLRLGETQETLARLVSKGLVQKEGDAYSLSPIALEIPIMVAQVQKAATGRLAPVSKGLPAMPAPMPASAAPAIPMADVANVFRQARERAGRERAQGGI